MKLAKKLSLAIGCLFLVSCASAPLKTYTFRLRPNQDLKLELARIAQENHLQSAAIISAVGSLKKVALRYANQTNPNLIDGYHEIVSLSGTLAEDSMHVHLAVSDSTGKTVGGHLVEGNLIYTTCELVLLEQPELQFSREEDPTYGYKELVVRPRQLSKVDKD